MLYHQPSQMEPLLPLDGSSELAELSVEVIRQSAALGSMLHPTTRVAVAGLLRNMNSYYSNLMEGHHTLPREIDQALKKRYSSDPARRVLQLESAAHVEVQELIDERLRTSPHASVCSFEFLGWVHREFYRRMPQEYCFIEDPSSGKKHAVEPGKLRTFEVTVGRHVPPASDALEGFLLRFAEGYAPSSHDKVRKGIAVAASHHRLAWIHPFLDGNGRVTRLFTHAYQKQAGVDGHGLWAVTRGLARKRDDYMAALAAADEHRMGAFDGRGNLSEQGLFHFCRFFLRTSLDQIAFMSDLLQLDDLQNRILGFVDRQASQGKLKIESGLFLREVLLRGEVPRGEAGRIMGMSERSARTVVGELVRLGMLTSPSPKRPVRMGFPAHVVGYYFPRLYPEGAEMDEAG